MRLSKYKAKRDLKASPEPRAKVKRKKSKELAFVVQKHHARALHYDFRLEVGGVLKSWAIPKEPSTDPKVKRLAIQVEDHPYDYKDFEGTIPSGYGAGTVEIWDEGTYEILDEKKSMKAGLKTGGIHIVLKGKKLKGVFHLIRLKTAKKTEWLFFKGKEVSTEPKLSNLDKLYWPKEKITKGDLLDYYQKISPWLLPHLKDRPESLKRFPDGIEGISFFQKNLPDAPDWMETAKVQHENKKVNYALIQDEKSLAFLVNLGCIEFHPFSSRAKKLHFPDFLVFDLDPKGASFNDLVKIAQELHSLLEEIDVPSYCKTSGATGLHIAVPLAAKYKYPEALAFAERVAKILHARTPKLSTLERSLAKRGGKIYIDYRQNNFAQTIAAVYSVRARPGAPVSTPLKWAEVKKGLDPKQYTIKTIFARLKKMKDLYLPVLGKGIDLKAALKKLEPQEK